MIGSKIFELLIKVLKFLNFFCLRRFLNTIEHFFLNIFKILNIFLKVNIFIKKFLTFFLPTCISLGCRKLYKWKLFILKLRSKYVFKILFIAQLILKLFKFYHSVFFIHIQLFLVIFFESFLDFFN